MDFEELLCYSQTVIIIILGIGYLINFVNKPNSNFSKIDNKCPSCNYIISDNEVNYCSKCGNMLSHSEGISLEK